MSGLEISLEAAELPRLYDRHVFVCATQRPPTHPRGSCGAVGAQALLERLSIRAERDGQGRIGVTAAGCFGYCAAGPLLVVYPEGVWYQPKSVEDIDEIFATHLLGGALVERLVVVLAR